MMMPLMSFITSDVVMTDVLSVRSLQTSVSATIPVAEINWPQLLFTLDEHVVDNK